MHGIKDLGVRSNLFFGQAPIPSHFGRVSCYIQDRCRPWPRASIYLCLTVEAVFLVMTRAWKSWRFDASFEKVGIEVGIGVGGVVPDTSEVGRRKSNMAGFVLVRTRGQVICSAPTGCRTQGPVCVYSSLDESGETRMFTVSCIFWRSRDDYHVC